MNESTPRDRQPGPDRSERSARQRRGGGRDTCSGAAARAALDELHARGRLADIDRHFGAFAAEVDGGAGSEVALAAALVSAHAREGHTCAAMASLAGSRWPDADGAELPELAPWLDALSASPAVRTGGAGERRPLVLDSEGRLYLERLWTAERQVARGIRRLARPVEAGPSPAPEGLDAALERFFPRPAASERPRAAARAASEHGLCVVTGGPGTGKTTTVAGIVALLMELGLAAPGRIALAAPTGKAAARLQESVRERFRALAPANDVLSEFTAEATTVHRLLLGIGRAGGKLAVDTLVVDEGSMVDLSLMGRILLALPDGARLILLGDASQLASVQPGAVFADLCRADESAASPLRRCIVRLDHNWRFDETGGVGRLATGIARGDAGAALAALDDPAEVDTGLRSLLDGAGFARFATAFADEHAAPLVRAMRNADSGDTGAVSDDGPSRRFQVLCAHRTGPFGSERFNALVERRLRVPGLAPAGDDFYPGRPLIVTRNDPRTGLSNGDTGVVILDAYGRRRVRFPELRDEQGQPRLVAPARLPAHESCFALTVHRAQGSEYDEVAFVPGPSTSRVATRELLYTAVTRARRRVVVHGTRESVAAALGRRTERASGLREALLAPAT